MAVADDDTIAALRDAAARRAGGYQILWGRDGTVLLVLVPSADGEEQPPEVYCIPRDAARRMGKRLVVAAERARRAHAVPRYEES